MKTNDLLQAILDELRLIRAFMSQEAGITITQAAPPDTTAKPPRRRYETIVVPMYGCQMDSGVEWYDPTPQTKEEDKHD